MILIIKFTTMIHFKFFSHIFGIALLLGSCSVCQKQNDYSYVIGRTPKKDFVIYYPFAIGDKICQMDTLTRRNKLNIVWTSQKSSRQYYMQLPSGARVVGMDSDWALLQFPNDRLLLVCFGYY